MFCISSLSMKKSILVQKEERDDLFETLNRPTSHLASPRRKRTKVANALEDPMVQVTVQVAHMTRVQWCQAWYNKWLHTLLCAIVPW